MQNWQRDYKSILEKKFTLHIPIIFDIGPGDNRNKILPSYNQIFFIIIFKSLDQAFSKSGLKDIFVSRLYRHI